MSDCIYSKLIEIQKAIKVPKAQQNKFGGYSFRSCEDIVEAAKKVLPEGVALILTDEVVNIGERYYVKAIASLFSASSSVNAVGYAREADARKGFSEDQLTGAASSYARKYALNGLFALDDTKDSDTNEYKKKADSAPPSVPKITPEQQKIKDRISAVKTEIKAAPSAEDANNAIHKHIKEIQTWSEAQQKHVNDFAASCIAAFKNGGVNA